MQQTVILTYKMLMNKLFNEDIDESWIEWALEMLEAGYESKHLNILAGMSFPFNQFELQDLTDRVLSDLKLDYKDKYSTIRKYAYYLISVTINNPNRYLSALSELKDICNNLNMDHEYMNFWSLYFAKYDLNESENQYYWKSATQSNIDEIIKEQFSDFIAKFEKQQ